MTKSTLCRAYRCCMVDFKFLNKYYDITTIYYGLMKKNSFDTVSSFSFLSEYSTQQVQILHDI